MTRSAQFSRQTKETAIDFSIVLDSTEESHINTGIPFFDHMLSHIAKHGRIKFNLDVKGDLEVDFHHTVEDVGIVFGDLLVEALSDMKGVARYGHFSLPMCEVLCNVAIDICKRPYLIFHIPELPDKIGAFDSELVEEFFHAVTNHAGLTLHINVPYGSNSHHIAEAIFKCFGHALRMATVLTSEKAVLSTKGMI